MLANRASFFSLLNHSLGFRVSIDNMRLPHKWGTTAVLVDKMLISLA